MTTTNEHSLGDALPKEIARVRDEVMPAYLAIGAAGVFALTLMRAELDRASKGDGQRRRGCDDARIPLAHPVPRVIRARKPYPVE